MEIQNAAFKPDNARSVVRPYVMSHGTLECHSLGESRKFYEAFLGLECVRHARPAMVVRCGLKFHIVCVEVGDKVHPLNVLNHWGLDVGSRAEMDREHGDAIANKDKYKIRQVQPAVNQHGVYSFYLEDLDHNGWEIQHYDGFQHDDMFEFGDRFSMDDDADVDSLKELEIQNSK